MRGWTPFWVCACFRYHSANTPGDPLSPAARREGTKSHSPGSGSRTSRPPAVNRECTSPAQNVVQLLSDGQKQKLVRDEVYNSMAYMIPIIFGEFSLTGRMILCLGRVRQGSATQCHLDFVCSMAWELTLSTRHRTRTHTGHDADADGTRVCTCCPRNRWHWKDLCIGYRY